MKRWLNKHTNMLLALPAILLTIVMIAYPIGYSLYMSLCEWNMSVNSTPSYVGFSNYQYIVKDRNFLSGLWFTIRYSVYAVVIETILGTSIALFASKIKRGGTFIKTVAILPMVTTPIVIGMLWKMMMDPAIGVFNTILKRVGLPTSTWLTAVDTVVPSLVLITVWFGTPMFMLIVLSGITSLPQDCYDAAYIDGANSWQTLTMITLPLLKQTIGVAVILKTIDSLKTFDIIYSSTQGGPQNATINLNYFIYKNLFEYFKIGRASAALIIFLGIVFALSVIMILLQKQNEVE